MTFLFLSAAVARGNVAGAVVPVAKRDAAAAVLSAATLIAAADALQVKSKGGKRIGTSHVPREDCCV